jgi:hypothetical protein
MSAETQPQRSRPEFLILLDRLEALGHKIDMALEAKANVTPMWLTKQELASHLRMSPRWIDDRVAEGMPVARKLSGKLLFVLADVEAWLISRGFLEVFNDLEGALP